MGRVDVELAFPGLDPTTKARVERTFAALKQRGISPIYVRDRRVALETVLRLIPKGSTVAHGSSTTLQEIGLVDQLKDPASGYRYMNLEWQAESDTTRRVRIRAKLSAEADFYLGSVQAIAETGEVVGADQSGSRQAFYVYGPPHVIWVAGNNKLVPTLDDAIRRTREVALPLEDQRTKRLGAPGSSIGKLVVYEWDRPGRITLILVGEPLGF